MMDSSNDGRERRHGPENRVANARGNDARHGRHHAPVFRTGRFVPIQVIVSEDR
jgi:hypothetical protein